MSLVTYKLTLPHQWTIHPMFYASLLTPYSKTKEHRENYSRPPPDLVGDAEQYKVKTICSHQHQGWRKQLQYLVKWLGYPESDNMWKPAGHLQTLLLLKEYHCQHLLESIKVMSIQTKPHPPFWLPPLPTALAATTTSTPQFPSRTYPRLHGTWTTTPSNHPLPRRSQSIESPRESPNLLNIARPMPPSAVT